jgi:hypothetical protein
MNNWVGYLLRCWRVGLPGPSKVAGALSRQIASPLYNTSNDNCSGSCSAGVVQSQGCYVLIARGTVNVGLASSNGSVPWVATWATHWRAGSPERIATESSCSNCNLSRSGATAWPQVVELHVDSHGHRHCWASWPSVSRQCAGD